MTRDRLIVFGIVGVALVLAVTQKVVHVTSGTLLLFGAAVPSIILHEVSHGVAALAFGDDTAKRAGRITLNPARHVDVFGTLILPALLALSGFGIFGYAKPVPINPSRMRHPQNDAVWVSLAGPTTNIVLALLAAILLRPYHAQFLAIDFGPLRFRALMAFGIINVVLAVFNLIPIPPLDGSAIVGRFMPKSWQNGWNTLQRYGMLILIAVLLLKPAALGRLLTPALRLFLRLIQ